MSTCIDESGETYHEFELTATCCVACGYEPCTTVQPFGDVED